MASIQGKAPAKKKSRPIRKAKRVVHRIVTTLHKREFVESVGIEVTEVFKGGSIGQGTTVPAQYDIDLVLYSRSIEPQKALEDGYYSDLLNKLDIYLKRQLKHNYKLEDTTEAALKFAYTLPDGKKLGVDLLLSPYWPSRDDLFSFLRIVSPPLKRLMFSASAAKWQTEFIRNQPMRVKELIRRAKAWRNREWVGDPKCGRPKSFLISLLVIVAYNRVPIDLQAMKKFKPLAMRVGNELTTLVKEISRNPNLDLTIPGTSINPAEYPHLLPDCPRIVDPTNPANNVYLSGVGPNLYGGGDGKWGPFTRKIDGIDLTQHV